MIYLFEAVTDEVIISKSRFITILTPITHQDQCHDVLLSIKKSYPKATHYCTAYILGEHGEFQGSSDDGEPSGTAGIPMLEILRTKQVTNMFVVVVRYFGGIKLGAGGLIRAYAGAVKDALAYGSYYQKIKAPAYRVHFNYHLIAKFDQLFTEATILDKSFLDEVIYTVCFADGNDSILDSAKHLFNNLVKIEDETLIIPWP